MFLPALVCAVSPLAVIAGPYDVSESDIRGVWRSETDEIVGIGRALWQAGQRDKAERKFNEAWKKAKTPSEKLSVAEVLVDFYLSAANSEAAIKVYEILLSDTSFGSDSTLMSRLYDGLGNVYFSDRLYVMAMKSYRMAERLVPVTFDSLSVSSLYSDMSRTFLESGDVEEALRLIKLSRSLVPSGDDACVIPILTTEAKIEARFGEFQKAYEKMVEAARLNGKVWSSEISFLLNSATPARMGQADKVKDDKSTDMETIRSAIEQADSSRRTAYATTLVVGLLSVASLIFLYLSFTRMRYYRDRSHKLDKKLFDAQRVISIIAHDSNNQFNALLGLTGVLAEKSKGVGGETEQLCRHIFSSAQLLYQMMNNLLTWSKSKEHLNPKKQVVSLYDCVRCCVSSVGLMAKDKDITVAFDGVPQDIKVFVDASHLEIILRNIISNAVKFTQRGGHVVVRASVYSKHAAVSVDDDGMGMSQEDVARFNKEQDLAPNPGTNNEHGNGIGLAICRDLVRNNGGSIVVEPGRLCGTSVTVLLNLADAGNK